jgi:hypothetical protein
MLAGNKPDCVDGKNCIYFVKTKIIDFEFVTIPLDFSIVLNWESAVVKVSSQRGDVAR